MKNEEEKTQEKPFLHLGDLVQLNSIDPQKQYRIAQIEPIFSDWVDITSLYVTRRHENGTHYQFDTLELAGNDLKEKLTNLGFDGVCDLHYLHHISEAGEVEEDIERRVINYCRCLGTPVIRNK